MINVLIPVVDKPEQFLKSAREICDDINLQLVIGVTKTIANVYDFNIPNAIVKVYDDGSGREEIINALQPLLLGEAVFIARKPFTREEFYQFINKEAQIVICEDKKMNPVSSLFNNLWRKIVRAIFGVKFFHGDTSLVYFNAGLGNVLTNVSNLSYCTRVDRWKGVTQDTVKSSSPKAKVNCDKGTGLRLLLFAILSLMIGVVATALISVFVKVNVVIGLLVACLDIICLSTSALLMITYLFNLKIGKKDIKKAIEVAKKG